MRLSPQMFALMTAMAWGIGGFFEKKGLHEGHLTPQMGIAIRTFIALLVLGAASFPHWRSVPQAGAKSLGLMVVGGGVVAGSLGMLCFYTAIKNAPLGKVMPIAFTAPLFGLLMGVLFGGESITLRNALGAAMATGGIVLLTLG